MTSNGPDRRTVLRVGGASIATVLIAGCMGSDDDDGGNGDAGNGDASGIEIDPGTDIVFDGYSTHWEDLQPSAIDGEENPTLVLEDGGEYTMEWINADGVTHDLEIQDEDGAVVDDLATDAIGGEGEGATLEFTATPEMAEYVCTFHSPQRGDIVVE